MSPGDRTKAGKRVNAPVVVTRQTRPSPRLVNHSAPSGPVVIRRGLGSHEPPHGCGKTTSDTLPEVVILPLWPGPLSPSVYQRAPSGPGVMPNGFLSGSSWNSVT